MTTSAINIFSSRKTTRFTKKTISTIALASCVTLLSACQSTPTGPVIQRANNTFETTGLGKTKILAQQQAINNAKKQCGGFKNPVILTDNATYNGVLGENTGRILDQATTVLGGILGSKASIARDDDYEYHITFNCQ